MHYYSYDVSSNHTVEPILRVHQGLVLCIKSQRGYFIIEQFKIYRVLNRTVGGDWGASI